MSDTLEEEKRRKLIEAGRRALEERKKKRLQQTPDGTGIEVKGPNSAPVDSVQSRRSDLESLRLSTLRAKQELELNKTTNELIDSSVRNDKTIPNGNSHSTQANHALPSPTNSPKLPKNEQTNQIFNMDAPAKPLSDITSTVIPSKIVEPSSSTIPNGTQPYSPKSDLRSGLIPSNGHPTTSSVSVPSDQKFLLSPFKPEPSSSPLHPASPILSPISVSKPAPPLETIVPKPQVVSQPVLPQPAPSIAVPTSTHPTVSTTQTKPQSPIASPRTEHKPTPSFEFTTLPSMPTTTTVVKPISQPEILSVKPTLVVKPIEPVSIAAAEHKNGSSEVHPENNTEPVANGTIPAKNGSSQPQSDKRLQVLMDEVSNKNKELEEMRKRMEQYQQKYDAEVKKNEKLMDKLEFIKRKEMEERPLLEEIVSRETLELVDKLKEENSQLQNQMSNLQTQFQSLEKKSKQQLETISQLMSEKNQITQEMQRRIDRILESQAMNIPSSQISPRPEIPNSAIESAQTQGKDAIRKLLEDKAILENKINEQWETIQSMSKQKTELMTRLANEAQRNEALIKENARLRNSNQAPPSPTAASAAHHTHPHTNGQHNHVTTAPAEVEVVQPQSSGGWLTYIPIVGSYFTPTTPAKSTRNV